MNASSILKRSSILYKDEPLFLSPQPPFNTTTSPISYETSWKIAQWHKTWIQTQIQSYLDAHPKHDSQVVIAYLAPNSPDLLLSMIGCMDMEGTTTLGCHDDVKIIPAMLNIRWTAEEIASALRVHKADPSALPSGHDNSPQQKQQHITFLLFGKGYQQCAKDGRQGENKEEKKENTQKDAILLFTSGTTSGAKGVRLSRLSLFLQAYAKTASPCYYNKETRMLATTVPFFHVGGLSSALAIMMASGTLVFPENDSVGASTSFNPKVSIQSMAMPGNTSITDGNKHNHDYCNVNTLVVVPAT